MRIVRLILGIDGASACWNMAVDEALLISATQGRGRETLRLYVFKPHAVTIGYFQRIREVVDLEKAKELGADVVRRFTGGGAVYHDTYGEVTYSYLTKAVGPLSDVYRSYEIICRAIVVAAKKLGVNAEFVPINDVVVKGRKFSGSAQARRGCWLLQHGTFMYATNLETLSQLLLPQEKKLRQRGLSSIRQRVTTISDELKRRVELHEVVEALIKGFGEAMGIKFVEDELSDYELRLAKELVDKYRSYEWNFRR